METTIDGILNRRVMLEQPAKGYRVAVDTVLLAASVPAQAGERGLDLGCGVGGAMLCVAARVSGVVLTGMDVEADMVELCRRNIVRNGFTLDADVSAGDATTLHPAFAGRFEHVLMNPPYHDEARHDVSDDTQKRAANTEKSGDLAHWIAAAAHALKPSGCLTLIHRADREKDILVTLAAHFGAIELIPIAPKEGASAKRIIVRARKEAGGDLIRKPPFILHARDGSFTEDAESILRHAAAMPF